MSSKTRTHRLDAIRSEGSDAGFSRRSFLARAGVATGAAASASVWLSGVTRGAPSTTDKTAVFINQRGGADGLSIVCPVLETTYQNDRPTIGVPPPPAMDRAWLDGTFAMSPGGVDYVNNIDWLAPYKNGDLVFVHGAGWMNQTRSHFTAMLNMEHGVNSGSSTYPQDGWGGRYMGLVPAQTNVVRGFGHGPLLPTILRGAPKTSAIADVANLSFPGPDNPVPGLIPTAPFRQHTISKSYAATPRVLAMTSAAQAFATLSELTSVNYPTPGTNGYPDTPLGTALANTAAVINDPNVHVETIHIDIGSWDHHTAQDPLGAGGKMYDILDDLSTSVGAFYADVNANGPGVLGYLMMIFTEFGRQIKENLDLGTDHGYGGLFVAMGSGVHPTSGGKGGTVYHEFTGPLSTSYDPFNMDALDITIDYRDIWREALENQLCLAPIDLAAVFPGFTPRVTPPGIIG